MNRFAVGCHCCAEPCTYPDTLCYTITDSPYFSGSGVMDYHTTRPAHIPAWTKNLANGCSPFGDTEGYFDRTLHYQFDCSQIFSLPYSPATGYSVDYSWTDSFYWYLWFPANFNFTFAYIIQIVHRVGYGIYHLFPFGASGYVPIEYWGWWGEGHFDTFQSCGVNLCEPPDNVYILSFPTYFNSWCPAVGCCPTRTGQAHTGDFYNPHIDWTMDCLTPNVVCPDYEGSMFIEIYTCDDDGSGEPVGRLGIIGGEATVSFTPYGAGSTGSKSFTGYADATCSYLDFFGGGNLPTKMLSGEASADYRTFHNHTSEGAIGFNGIADLSTTSPTVIGIGQLTLSGITEYKLGFVSTNKGQAIMRFRGVATCSHGQSSNPVGRLFLSGSASVRVSGNINPVGKLILSGLATTGKNYIGGGEEL